jgi:signal peptide peptidase SppA
MNNPILAEFSKDVWAMEPRALEAFLGRLAGIEIHNSPIRLNSSDLDTRSTWRLLVFDDKGRLQDHEVAFSPVVGPFNFPDGKRKSKMSITADGVAEIPVKGVLLKNVPAWLSWLGINATGYDEIREDIQTALDDKAVRSIRLKVESPGGQVSGVMEAAEAIYKAREQKPVGALIEDLGASGAYWLASQAVKIGANANAVVGSIGVYSVAVDYSKAAEMEGIKVHVISSGPHKGAGVPGAPITEPQLDALREVINGMAENFISDVARGRAAKVEDVRTWASGRTWLAGVANEMGLIDQVVNGQGKNGAPDVPAAAAKTPELEESVMAETPKTPPAVAGAGETVAPTAPDQLAIERKRQADIRAAFPGEDAFALEQIVAGASVEQAEIAFGKVLRERNAKLTKELADSKAAKAAEAPKPQPSAGGAPPLPQSGEAGRSEQDFMELAKAHAKEHGCGMVAAMSAVAKAHPESHEAYIEKQRSRIPEVRARKRELGIT